MRRELARLSEQWPKAALRALLEEGLELQHDSMQDTPVDLGILKGSHETILDEAKGQVTVRCGGPAAPYAIPVHEKVEVFHRVGKAKFLEDQLMVRVTGTYLLEALLRRIRSQVL